MDVVLVCKRYYPIVSPETPSLKYDMRIMKMIHPLETHSIVICYHQHLFTISSNSDEFTSELVENLEEMLNT